MRPRGTACGRPSRAFRSVSVSVHVPLALGVLSVALFLSAELELTDRPGFPLDDAWIHAVFARNLAEGQGFSFNPGEPVGGSTAPLWTVIMAAAYRVTGGMVWGTKALGSLLFLTSILLAYALVHRMTGDRCTAVIAGTLVTLLRWNVWGAVSGMEIPLYVALSLAGLLLYLAAAGSAHRQRLELGSTLALALAGLARPECLSLVAATRLLSFTDQLRRVPRPAELPRRLAHLLLHALLVAAVLAPVALFNHRTVGSFTPSTFNAKVGTQNIVSAFGTGDLGLVIEHLLAIPLAHAAILILRLLATNPFLLPFAVLGFHRLWPGVAGPHHDRSRLLPVAFLLQPVAMSLVEPTTRLSFRYIATVLVLYSLLGAMGIMTAWRLTQRPSSSLHGYGRLRRLVLWGTGAGILGSLSAILAIDWCRPLLMRLLARLSTEVGAAAYERAADHLLVPTLVAAAVFLGILWGLVVTHRPRAVVLSLSVLSVLSQAALTAGSARRYATEVQNINSLHIACGEWIDRNLPGDAVIALDDIGGITYTCRRRMVDMIGLVSPRALAYRKAGRSRIDYLRDERPGFVATVKSPRDMEDHPELFRLMHWISIENNVASVNDTIAVLETAWHHQKPRGGRTWVVQGP